MLTHMHVDYSPSSFGSLFALILFHLFLLTVEILTSNQSHVACCFVILLVVSFLKI